jgi:putative ABC transport system permease protein
MRLALRELRRRPGRFLIAAGMLTVLVFLLLFLGGLLDGLYNGSTGALRAQEGELLVFSSESRDSLIRSRIPAATRATVAAVPGVDRTWGLGTALVGAKVPGQSELADVAALGYQGGVAGVPAPPPVGEAWADRRLDAAGVDRGMVLGVGRTRVPVRVRGFVADTSYLLQGGLWVAPRTWRDVLAASRPDAALAPGAFQALSVAVRSGTDPTRVASAIDRATRGSTHTLTTEQAIRALPGVESQRTTFRGIIGVTLLVAGVVVALFFALFTLERAALYGVLKAIGASSGQLAGGLLTQAAITATAAFAAGGVLALGLAAIVPADIPLELLPGRAALTFAGVVLAALAGSAISLRRIIRVDPASPISRA